MLCTDILFGQASYLRVRSAIQPFQLDIRFFAMDCWAYMDAPTLDQFQWRDWSLNKFFYAWMVCMHIRDQCTHSAAEIEREARLKDVWEPYHHWYRCFHSPRKMFSLFACIYLWCNSSMKLEAMSNKRQVLASPTYTSSASRLLHLLWTGPLPMPGKPTAGHPRPPLWETFRSWKSEHRWNLTDLKSKWSVDGVTATRGVTMDICVVLGRDVVSVTVPRCDDRNDSVFMPTDPGIEAESRCPRCPSNCVKPWIAPS